MRSQLASALFIILASGFAAGQSPVASSPNPQASAQPVPLAVYFAGPGVTAPGLLPVDSSIKSVRNCLPLDGAVMLSGVVDADGLPRDMKTLGFFEPDLGKLALSLVAGEKFKPGMHDGIPAPIAVTIEMGLQTCAKREKGDAAESYQLTLRSHPVQALSVRSEPLVARGPSDSNGTPRRLQVGGRVSPPVPLVQPEAEYSDYARKKKISGICLLGLVVDVYGVPQNIHIVKGLEPSLDQKAIEAVQKYRFKPAMKDGTIPVPVVVNVEVNFRLYNKW